MLATENGGQRVAVEPGFAATSGDVVIVLDSDDVLAARPAAPAGSSLGSRSVARRSSACNASTRTASGWARRSPATTTCRRRASSGGGSTRTSAYPTPPGSGNAYARWFLELVLPADDSVGDAADSALVAAAPLLGDVITVPEVVVTYRQHGANDSDLLRDATRFTREVDRARRRWAFALSIAPAPSMDDRTVFRSRETLQFRVAALIVAPATPPALPGDGRLRMLRDALVSPLHPGPETTRRRLLVSSWCLGALLVPWPAAKRLVQLRFGRGQRGSSSPAHKGGPVVAPRGPALQRAQSSGSERLSIIIVNHNYEQFVAKAIASALEVEWHDLEVIVVDDGSTDGSAGVIQGFAGKATTLLLPKVGHIAATNAGWERATGDVVVFLDADDFVPANLARETFAVWGPDVSKVQFRMQRVDEAGRLLGPVFPHRPVRTRFGRGSSARRPTRHRRGRPMPIQRPFWSGSFPYPRSSDTLPTQPAWQRPRCTATWSPPTAWWSAIGGTDGT